MRTGPQNYNNRSNKTTTNGPVANGHGPKTPPAKHHHGAACMPLRQQKTNGYMPPGQAGKAGANSGKNAMVDRKEINEV